jgi:hypothetical protein
MMQSILPALLAAQFTSAVAVGIAGDRLPGSRRIDTRADGVASSGRAGLI